ncbi:MAG: hypothetical protein WDA68_02875 [Phycisphaerae bacterium]
MEKEGQVLNDATIADAVCPHCFKQLTKPLLTDQGKDAWGRVMRTYYGWCFACNIGTMVIQFLRSSRWIIHKYQDYELLDTLNLCRPSGDWVGMNELPEPAPVITGPGGDYKKQHELSGADLKELLSSLQGALNRTLAVINKIV